MTLNVPSPHKRRHDQLMCQLEKGVSASVRVITLVSPPSIHTVEVWSLVIVCGLGVHGVVPYFLSAPVLAKVRQSI